MDVSSLLAAQFEEHRPRLRALAYRMLGSLSEADDVVQEAWLRLSRDDREDVANLGQWLTTVVARLCLNALESRRLRREDALDDHLPDPVVSAPGAEQALLQADLLGLALLVVLDTLAPAERLAFVLHDLFGLPFEEIAPMVDRTPAAARQLASRARRRVQGAAPAPDAEPGRQRELVSAFLAAVREGDLERLLAVLDPEVVLRADLGAQPLRVVRGAQAVARGATGFSRLARSSRPALVNGVPGVVAYEDGRPASVLAFTVSRGRIVGIDILSDPARLARLELPTLAG